MKCKCILPHLVGMFDIEQCEIHHIDIPMTETVCRWRPVLPELVEADRKEQWHALGRSWQRT
jgi:hypothetical protein